ncbi:hypothetical protein [Campylobacter coli]|uniref:hypothetical protein n=1 Tax=Campylobacter coli TaxID=195 RepID=UPI00092FE28E|nr:hypothetical protein [Campylobacter coli]
MGSEIKVGNETHFVNFSYLKKKFPQILSNGCKYYRNDYNYKIGESNFNFKDYFTNGKFIKSDEKYTGQSY